MFNKERFTKLPWGMIGLVFGIALIGLAAVYSATYTSRGPSPLFYKQLIWISVGVVIMFLALIPDYHTVGRYAYVVYACSVLLLILVMAIGRTGMGAQRWLAVGPFVFQPSELAKLSMTLALARFFAEDPKRGGYELKDLAVPGAMVLRRCRTMLFPATSPSPRHCRYSALSTASAVLSATRQKPIRI